MLPGARQFFERRGAPLPYDAEVKWLGSDGNQYIDTGIVPGSDIEFEFWFSASAYNASFFPLFGSNSSGNYLGVQRNSGGTPYSVFVWRGSSTKREITPKSAENYEGVVSLHGDTFTFKENTYTISAQEFTGDASMWYGRINGVQAFGGPRQIGSCKIWKDGVAVRDFIPVRVGSGASAVGYMYDRVSGQLFRNAGTGAFTIGPDKTSWQNPYVTDGLVAMWDGEWNAGGGVHDAAATTWKDIVGGIELEVNSNASLSWNSEGLVSASAIAGRYAIQNTNVPDALCAQILLIAKSGTSYSFSNGPLVMNLNSLSNGRYSLGISNDGVYRDGAGDGTTRIYATTSADLTIALADGLLVTMNYGSVKPKFADEFYIGNNVISYTGTAWGGGNSNLGVGGQSTWVACQGVTLARICLYSRNLAAAEIAANYAIDKARFNLP